MAITRNDTDQVFDRNGNVISSTPVARDVTLETNYNSLYAKASQALTANATFLALASPTAAQVAAQVKLLTRETNALLRLLLGALTDISDT